MFFLAFFFDNLPKSMEFYYDKFIMEMHFCYRSEFKKKNIVLIKRKSHRDEKNIK